MVLVGVPLIGRDRETGNNLEINECRQIHENFGEKKTSTEHIQYHTGLMVDPKYTAKTSVEKF